MERKVESTSKKIERNKSPIKAKFMQNESNDSREESKRAK
jgi:hypothetical protein